MDNWGLRQDIRGMAISTASSMDANMAGYDNNNNDVMLEMFNMIVALTFEPAIMVMIKKCLRTPFQT